MELPNSCHADIVAIWGFLLGTENQTWPHALQSVHVDVEVNSTGVCNCSRGRVLEGLNGKGTVNQTFIENHRHSRVPIESPSWINFACVVRSTCCSLVAMCSWCRHGPARRPAGDGGSSGSSASAWASATACDSDALGRVAAADKCGAGQLAAPAGRLRGGGVLTRTFGD